MIRFSAFLVIVALGLLVAGVVTSKLMLVYVAIGVSGVALLALGAGALIRRNELFGRSESAGAEPARPTPAGGYVPPGQPEPQVAPWETPVPAASAWAPKPAAAQPGPSRAGYLPAEQSLPTQPVKAQPADVAATAWGSGFPFPPERPPERQADVQRRPAAFTPRPPAAQPSPSAPGVPGVPGVPAPAPGAWEWRVDAPATQPLREIRRPEPSAAAAPQAAASPQVGPGQPPTQDYPPAVPDQSAARAELPADDEQPAEHPPAEHPPAEQVSPVDQVPAPAEDSRGPEEQPRDEHPDEDQQTQQFPVAVSTATEPAPSQPDTAVSESGPDAAEPASATADLDREVTVVPGVPRYHNPHCLLIRFMGQDDLEQMTLGAARQTGCTPCRACLPDQPEESPELDPAEPEHQVEIVLDVLPRLPGLRARSRSVVDREHLAGDQPRVLGQGQDHLRVVR